MKKIVGPVLLVLALVGVELILRGVLPPAAAEPDLWRAEGSLQVLQEDRHAFVDGADWRTDAGGHRRELEARRDHPTSLRVLVLGSSFTAGVGLEDEELYPALFEGYLREYTPHKDAVVLQAVARGPAPARARWYARLAQDLAPDRVIFQVEPQDQEEIAPLAFDQGLPVSRAAPDEPLLALLRPWRRWRGASARAQGEAMVRDYIDREGFSAEMTRRARERSIRIQQALRERRPLEVADREYLRTLIRVEAAQDRDVQEEEARRAWTTLLDQILSQGIRVAVLFTGPGALNRTERGAFLDLAVEEVFAPMISRDEHLWVDGHPSTLVHEQVARALLARLGSAGLLGPDVAVPDSWEAQAEMLKGLQDRIEGQDAESARQARESLQTRQEFRVDHVPFWVMGGLRPGGLVEAEGVVELLCFPGYRSEALEVVADIPADGPAPSLTLSFARLATEEELVGSLEDQGDGRRLITWRVADPGVVYRDLRLPLELTFRAADGPLDVRLHHVEWLQGDG